MAWNRTSLSDRIARVLADIDGAIDGAASRLRRSMLGVIGKSVSGLAHELDAHIATVALNIHTSTADEATVRQEAADLGLTPAAATAASGPVTLAGTVGMPVGVSTVLQRRDGVDFETLQAAIIGSDGTVEVQIVAQTAGLAGNTLTGVSLSFVSPVSGVSSQAVVTAGGISGGNEEEGVESLRSRILARKRNPIRGGAIGDYTQWLHEIYPAATVWEYPLWLGPGTYGVSFVFWDRPDILPTDAEMTAVRAHLDARRPGGMLGLEVFAPILDPTNPEIHAVPNTLEVRTSIAAELADLYRRESEPGGTIRISRFREAVSIAAGEEDHDLISPLANINASPGYLPVVGDIDWGG